MSVLVEAAVASADEARAAVVDGADRVEVCSFAVEGGVTPADSPTREVCTAVAVPVHVLIRPRGGGFHHTENEIAVMEAQIDLARSAGAAGIVLGALLADGRLDRIGLLRLIARARPMSVTFHRAIDLAKDPAEMVEALVALGVDRVLTSGGATTALEGAAVIRRMVNAAEGALAVMAGGGVRAANVREVVARSGVREVHARDVRGMAAALRGAGSRG